MNIEVCRTNSDCADFRQLAEKLTRFLSEINGEKDSFYQQFNKVDKLSTVIVVYADGQPVGAGAFRSFGDDAVEVKRMYVEPELRRQGIGDRLLVELETWASEIGAATAVLETSKRLLPAVSLYRRAGYEVIPNYEPYVGVEDSVCMRKRLPISP